MIHTVLADGRNPGLNDALASWAAGAIGLARGFEGPYTTLGVFKDSNIRAVFVYNNYQPEAGVIELHGASTGQFWMTRAVLHEMFAYPFDTLGCQTIVSRASSKNDRVRRMYGAFGWQSVTVPRLRGRDEDEVIYWLHDDTWRGNKFHRGKA